MKTCVSVQCFQINPDMLSLKALIDSGGIRICSTTSETGAMTIAARAFKNVRCLNKFKIFFHHFI
jgi:hypothetical protein